MHAYLPPDPSLCLSTLYPSTYLSKSRYLMYPSLHIVNPFRSSSLSAPASLLSLLELVILLGLSILVTPQLFCGSHLTSVSPRHRQVNGVRVDLPAEVLPSVTVRRNPDGSVLVHQKSGVQVQLGTSGQLTVMVSRDHAGMLCGACGNFDGEPTNDKYHSNEDTTVEHWRAQDFSPW